MAQQKDSTVPQIRFKSFVGKWGLQTIHDLIDQGAISPPQDGNHGELHPKTYDYVIRGIPFIMANNIRDGYIDTHNCSHITREQADSLKKGFATTDDVLLTHKGTVGEIAVVCDSDFPFIMLTPQVTYYRILDREKLDHRFLASSFATGKFQRALKEVSGGGTRAYIGITQQRNLALTIPPESSEQSQLGDYFKELDRLISLQQRKHDKMVTLKRAMLQKMFPQPGATTPEIRFKGFSDDWEEDDFGNRVAFFSGLTYSPVHVVSSGGTLVLRSSNVKDGEVVDADNVYVDTEAVNCVNVETGDIVVVVRNGSRSLIGKHAQIKKSMNNAVIGAFMTGIRYEHPSFINALLDSSQFTKEIEKNLGATINQITTGSFKVMRFAFPKSDEQQKIGSYFRTLDELISKYATHLKKIKQIKSACLEKMFV